jgi:hypothetical protein
MSFDAVLYEVHVAFEGRPMQLIQSDLCGYQECKFREVFAE